MTTTAVVIAHPAEVVVFPLTAHERRIAWLAEGYLRRTFLQAERFLEGERNGWWRSLMEQGVQDNMAWHAAEALEKAARAEIERRQSEIRGKM